MLTAFGARNARLVVSVALISLVAGRASPAQMPITELARVKPSDNAAGQCFSYSVAVSGGIVVVGDFVHDVHQGAGYVFRRGSSGNWIQDAKLVAPDPTFDKVCGYSAAISGSTIVLGAPGDDFLGDGAGAAYVFERGPQGVWTNTVKLLASDGAGHDGFGCSAAIDHDTIAVGSPRFGGVGQVYVFERNAGGAGQWGEVARLMLAVTMVDDRFGSSLSLDGNDLAVGAPSREDYPLRPGRVGLFHSLGGVWAQSAEVVTPTGALDQFGFRVDLSGNSLAVTALMDPTVAPYGAGRAWIFDRHPQTGAWSVAAELLDPLPGGDAFAYSVALDGDTAIVGAINDSDLGQATGSAHVFSRNTGGANAWGWGSEIHGSVPGAFDYFGASVDLSSGVAVIGAMKGSQSSLIPEWGSAYIFTLDVASTWSSYCTSGSSFAGCTPRMSAIGRPSASASTPFTVRVDSAEGQRFGAILYGAKAPSTTPWGTGGTSHLCVQAPVQRTNIQSSGGTALACDGSLDVDWNAFVAAHPTAQGTPLAAGETLWFQGWLRDINAPKSSMLSDALAVTLMP